MDHAMSVMESALSQFMNPYYALIIECCRYEPDIARLEMLSSLITDWERLLTSAYAHGVYPLVTKYLKTIPAIPLEVKDQLKMTNLQIARQNMMMTSELIRIMKLLESHGIRALALKGPVLSQIIHGDVTTRQYTDIDILVAPDLLYITTKILCENRYIYEYDVKFTKNIALLKATKDLTLTDKKTNISVELHWRLFSGRLFRKSNSNIFFESKQSFRINNHDILTINDEVLYLYLLLHGSKHLWERLEWIVDIDRLARAKNYDWNSLEKISKKMEILPMVLLGCSVTHRLCNTPFPESLMEQIHNDKSIKNATQIIIEQLSKDLIFKEGNIMNTIYFMGLGKGNNRWMEYVFRFLRYTKEDVYTINLPNSLSSLYHVIHLFNTFSYRIKKLFGYV